MKDATFDPARSPQVAVAINLIQDLLVRQLGADPSCISRLDALRTGANSGCSSTTRRLELELMHVGKVSACQSSCVSTFFYGTKREL